MLPILNRLLAKIARVSRPVDINALPQEGPMPDFAAAVTWLNSPPLTRADLAGKVVLADFWTYSCVNCLRTLPWLKAWQATYGPLGLVIVGIHTPEFEFERDPANVTAAVNRFGLTYPVALDNDYALWNAYGNRYWPAHYFVDGRGIIRYSHFGEGSYEHSEQVIRALLAEAGADLRDVPPTRLDAPEYDLTRVGSPETYLGWDRVEHLGSPETARPEVVTRFSAVARPALNVFYLNGDWRLEDQYAEAATAGASVVFRFQAARANLVMDGKGQRVEVLLDGRTPQADELGADVRLDGDRAIATLDIGRMYELVATGRDYGEKTLELRFLDPGVRCYAFTFG